MGCLSILLTSGLTLQKLRALCDQDQTSFNSLHSEAAASLLFSASGTLIPLSWSLWQVLPVSACLLLLWISSRWYSFFLEYLEYSSCPAIGKKNFFLENRQGNSLSLLITICNARLTLLFYSYSVVILIWCYIAFTRLLRSQFWGKFLILVS